MKIPEEYCHQSIKVSSLGESTDNRSKKNEQEEDTEAGPAPRVHWLTNLFKAPWLIGFHRRMRRHRLAQVQVQKPRPQEIFPRISHAWEAHLIPSTLQLSKSKDLQILFPKRLETIATPNKNRWQT